MRKHLLRRIETFPLNLRLERTKKTPETHLAMSLTSIARPFFMPRAKAIEKYADSAEKIQRRVLKHLLERAGNTEWGKKYGYSDLICYEYFARTVPINTY